MTYYKFKCPHCGKVVARENSLAADKSGCPFRTCPNCGKTYIDNHCLEPALRPYKERGILYCIGLSLLGGILFGFGVTLLFVLIAELAGVLSDYSWEYGVIWLVAAVLIFVLCLIKLLNTREKNNKAEYKAWLESDARLRNVEYAKILKQAGFKVPEHYFWDHEKDFLDLH